jgi:hypothetical protein
VKSVKVIIGVSPAQTIVTTIGKVRSTSPYRIRVLKRHRLSPTFSTLEMS